MRDYTATFDDGREVQISNLSTGELQQMLTGWFQCEPQYQEPLRERLRIEQLIRELGL